MAELGSAVKTLIELPFERHMIVRGPGSEQVHGKVQAFLTQTLDAGGTASDHAAA